MRKEGRNAHYIRSTHTHVLGSGEHQHRHRQITIHPTRSFPWISLSYFSFIVIIIHTLPIFFPLLFFCCCFLFQAVSFYISFHSSLYFLNVSTAHGCYYKRSFLLFYYLSLQGHHHLPSSSPLITSFLPFPSSTVHVVTQPHPQSDSTHIIQALFNVVLHSLFFLSHLSPCPSTFPFSLSDQVAKPRTLVDQF